MNNSENQSNQNNIGINNPIDECLKSLSYYDIHPKGIDNDFDIICMKRHLKSNYW